MSGGATLLWPIAGFLAFVLFYPLSIMGLVIFVAVALARKV